MCRAFTANVAVWSMTDAIICLQNVVSGVCVLPALIPEGWDDHYNMRQVRSPM